MATATKAAASSTMVESCSCGEVKVNGSCINPDCEMAAKAALPKGAVTDSVAVDKVNKGFTLAEPRAFTIRGSVD